MSKSPTSLLKDHDVRLAIYRLLLVLSSGFERQTKRTIALSKILVRKNITTPDEIRRYREGVRRLRCCRNGAGPETNESREID